MSTPTLPIPTLAELPAAPSPSQAPVPSPFIFQKGCNKGAGHFYKNTERDRAEIHRLFQEAALEKPKRPLPPSFCGDLYQLLGGDPEVASAKPDPVTLTLAVGKQENGPFGKLLKAESGKCPHVFTRGMRQGEMCGKPSMDDKTYWCRSHGTPGKNPVTDLYTVTAGPDSIRLRRNVTVPVNVDVPRKPLPPVEEVKLSDTSVNTEPDTVELLALNFGGHAQTLSKVFSEAPLYSEKIPLPCSRVHMFINGKAMPQEGPNIKPKCPIFQLAWLAFNGMLHREMTPQCEVEPSRNAYENAVAFLKSVRARKEVLDFFEQYYAANVYCNSSASIPSHIFQFYTQVKITEEADTPDQFVTLFKVDLLSKKVERVINGSMYSVDDIETVESAIAEAIHNPSWFTVKFGPISHHIYEPADDRYY
jgi:hypothetical protein